MSIRIDCCLCYKKSFAEILEHARQTGSQTITELQEGIDFGGKCGLCLPYVRRMLKTGETVFFQVISDDLDI